MAFRPLELGSLPQHVETVAQAGGRALEQIPQVTPETAAALAIAGTALLLVTGTAVWARGHMLRQERETPKWPLPPDDNEEKHRQTPSRPRQPH